MRFVSCLLLAAAFAIGVPGRAAADAEAEALLAASATAMGQVQSFHFVITVSNGELVVLDALELTRAEGDFQKPHTLKVSVNGKVKVLPVTANVIIVDDNISLNVDRFELVTASLTREEVLNHEAFARDAQRFEALRRLKSAKSASVVP